MCRKPTLVIHQNALRPGVGPPISIGLILVISVGTGALAFVYLNSAPPTILTMASGPDGSAFKVRCPSSRPSGWMSAGKHSGRGHIAVVRESLVARRPAA